MKETLKYTLKPKKKKTHTEKKIIERYQTCKLSVFSNTIFLLDNVVVRPCQVLLNNTYRGSNRSRTAKRNISKNK